jgi:hypothetical protein
MYVSFVNLKQLKRTLHLDLSFLNSKSIVLNKAINIMTYVKHVLPL